VTIPTAVYDRELSFQLKLTELPRAEFVIANYSILDISVIGKYQYLHRHKTMQVFY